MKNEEEDEQRLFCERARLFHWDKSSGSWKTRGLGDAKILKNPKTGKCRLVMRRDQVCMCILINLGYIYCVFVHSVSHCWMFRYSFFISFT